MNWFWLSIGLVFLVVIIILLIEFSKKRTAVGIGVVGMTALVLLAAPPVANYALVQNCTNITDNFVVSYPVFVNFTYDNGTQGQNVTGYTNVTESRVIDTICYSYIDHPSPKKDIRPSNYGYVCHEETDYVVCDTYKDGNADGYCDERGGETCCRVSRQNGLVTCKNSFEGWEDKPIPLVRLGQ